MQVVDRCDGTQLTQLRRSLFGLVKVWNALPKPLCTQKQFHQCKQGLRWHQRTHVLPELQDGKTCFRQHRFRSRFSLDIVTNRRIISQCHFTK